MYYESFWILPVGNKKRKIPYAENVWEVWPTYIGTAKFLTSMVHRGSSMLRHSKYLKKYESCRSDIFCLEFANIVYLRIWCGISNGWSFSLLNVITKCAHNSSSLVPAKDMSFRKTKDLTIAVQIDYKISSWKNL